MNSDKVIGAFDPLPEKGQAFEKACERYNELSKSQILRKLEDVVKQKMRINIMFIMDVTGSMEKWIGKMKNKIEKILE